MSEGQAAKCVYSLREPARLLRAGKVDDSVGKGQDTLNTNENKVGLLHVSSLFHLGGTVARIGTEGSRKMDQEN